ncbi:RNA ligase family protein [Kitasatospora sp. NPDC097643]|uniref:RNA ligase family protein n=1 Tax=Kitasatospora sp. NPDC097643 TaxID=3157230 RepID=UPI0033270881
MSETAPGAAPEAEAAVPRRAELRPYPKVAARERRAVHGSGEWVATEKVHGAHFAAVCDAAGAVRPAKRRELLDGDGLDGFFGVSRIWPVLSVAAGRFAALLRRTWGAGAVVTVYGELAGGCYPHPDVPTVAGAHPVQTSVWYSPGREWLVFDAMVETAEGRWWIADRALREAAGTAGLMCVPVLGYGPLVRLQELPAEFPSRVPALFGLPELAGLAGLAGLPERAERADNLAEGYVLKPAGEWNETERGPRPVVKVKQPAFAEDARYAGARPYLPPPQGAAGVPAWLLGQATVLLTPARAASAVSKLGPGASPDTVAEEIVQDVTDELAEAVGGLDDDVLHALRQALGRGALSLAGFDLEDRWAARLAREPRKRGYLRASGVDRKDLRRTSSADVEDPLPAPTEG